MSMPKCQLPDEKQKAANRLKCLTSHEDLTARDIRHYTKGFENALRF